MQYLRSVVHQLDTCAEWEQQLRSYVAQEPSTKIYDSLDAVAALQNRQSMLAPLTEPLQLHPLGPDKREASTAERDMLSCAAPTQVSLQAGTSCFRQNNLCTSYPSSCTLDSHATGTNIEMQSKQSVTGSVHSKNNKTKLTDRHQSFLLA